MLDTAFESLKSMDWGTDLANVAPIDDAAVAAHDNADARRDLENRLVAALKGPLSVDARGYICRKLALVGSSASVPALATLLVDKDNSHMARFALERITAPEAGQALRDALSKVSGNLKIGVIGSLGSRRDSASSAALGALLRDSDPAIARAAAIALGDIGSVESAKALQTTLSAGNSGTQSVLDSLLACAEALLAGNKTADAHAIYKSLSGDRHGRLVRLAATRGLLACASKPA